MSVARNKARTNRGTRGNIAVKLKPTHHATTGERLTDVESALPNLQRIAAPIANSNQLLSF